MSGGSASNSSEVISTNPAGAQHPSSDGDESPDGWDADVRHAVGVSLAAGLRTDERIAYMFNEPPVEPMFAVYVSFPRALLLSLDGLIPGAAQRAVVWFHRLRMSVLVGPSTEGGLIKPRWWRAGASASRLLQPTTAAAYTLSFSVHFPEDLFPTRISQAQYCSSLRESQAVTVSMRGPQHRAVIHLKLSTIFGAAHMERAVLDEGQRVATCASTALHSAASSSAGTASVTSLVRMGNSATLGGGSAQHSARNHGFGGYDSRAMTMASFRRARALQINDDWQFPKFLALVMRNDALGQAVAIAARASVFEAQLDAQGAANIEPTAILPVGQDSFFKECASVTERVRSGDLNEDSFTVRQALLWCCGSQVFSVHSDLDGCCMLLFSSAKLAVTGGVPASQEFARLAMLARVARVLSRALSVRERDVISSDGNTLQVERLLAVAEVLTCSPRSTPPVRLSKGWDGTDYEVAAVDNTKLPGVSVGMVVEQIGPFLLYNEHQDFVSILQRGGALLRLSTWMLRGTREGVMHYHTIQTLDTNGGKWLADKELESVSVIGLQETASGVWTAICSVLLEAYGSGCIPRAAHHSKRTFELALDPHQYQLLRGVGSGGVDTPSDVLKDVILARLGTMGIEAPQHTLRSTFVLQLPPPCSWACESTTFSPQQVEALRETCRLAAQCSAYNRECVATAKDGYIFPFVEVVQVLLNRASARGDYSQRVVEATTELDLKCQLHAGGVSDGGRGGKSERRIKV